MKPVNANDALRSLYQRRLNDRNYEVRLLELYQPTEDRKYLFQCRLRYHALNEAPPYSALSYCWGDAADRRVLMVDGRRIAVPRNLLTALRQLWSMEQRLVWVDYLCINQADDEEKSGQVRMMDTIYAKAQPVFAWLGPEADDSELAMATLGASRRSEQLGLPEEVEVACDAVVRLFSRPYFRRTWIIQEICRARSPIVVCGQRWTHWGTMLNRLDMLGDSVAAQYAHSLIKPLRTMRYWDLFRLRADTQMGLISLLIMSRRSLARDPRDKLYALLSLAKDGRVLIPTPNYSQTVEQVFLDTARSMIADHDHTDVILLAHRTRGVRDLPSWVPDWANLQSVPPPWIEEALAEKYSLLNPPNMVHRNVLEVQGYCDDVIADVLDTIESEFEELAVDETDEIPCSEDCNWESVVDTLWLGLTLGVEESERLRPAMQVLYNLCNEEATDDRESSCLANWLWHNRARKIGCCTLQRHIETYLDKVIPDDPEEKDQEEEEYEGDEEDDEQEQEQDQEMELARSALEEGFERLERLRMVFAVTRNGHLRIVYRASEKDDQIYILENCPLPVILRDSSHDRFRLVGEVFVSRDFQSTADTNFPEPVLIE